MSIIINSGSSTQAEYVLHYLRHTIGSLHATPVNSHGLNLKNWVLNKPPSKFTLSTTADIFTVSELITSKCSNTDLNSKTVAFLLSGDSVVNQLRLTYEDKLDFTVTHNLHFKKITTLSFRLEEDIQDDEQEFRALFFLMTKELSHLIKDIRAHC